MHLNLTPNSNPAGDGHPGIMKFKLADDIPHQVLPAIPWNSPIRRIALAETEFTTGDFGCFSTQVLRTPSCAISWLNFSFLEDTRLRPVTDDGIVAFYGTLEGNIECELQGFGKTTLEERKMSLYYIPPESENHALFKKGSYEAVYISFSSGFIARFMKHYPQFKSLYERLVEKVKKGDVQSLVHITVNEIEILNKIRFHKKEKLHFYLEGIICDLLENYFSIYEAGIQIKPLQIEHESSMREVDSFIQNNLDKPLPISQLCKMAKMNANSFSKQFKKVFNKPPVTHIKVSRVRKAAPMLLSTSLTIHEISILVGFSKPDYFSNVFRKEFKTSPSDYRKNNKN